MQLWGGEGTKEVYNILESHPDFHNKVVLSKVRFKEMAEKNGDPEAFVIQDVKFNGKFTARGTDFDTHLLTLNEVSRRITKNNYRNRE